MILIGLFEGQDVIPIVVQQNTYYPLEFRKTRLDTHWSSEGLDLITLGSKTKRTRLDTHRSFRNKNELDLIPIGVQKNAMDLIPIEVESQRTGLDLILIGVQKEWTS